jgi:hypothetical protein
MSASRIEWTEPTWNPVTGCTKISPGCQHCYAETMALRLQAMGAPGYARGFGLTLHEDRLDQPLGRKKPTVYFVCSMADLFHEDVPDAFVDRVLAVIRQTPRHTDQILTKRAERLPGFFANRPVPDNVWLGVTVENRRHGLPRIAHLRQIPARVRFLSVEPLASNRLDRIGSANPVLDAQFGNPLVMPPVAGDQTGAAGQGDGRDQQVGIRHPVARALQVGLEATEAFRRRPIQLQNRQRGEKCDHQRLIGLGGARFGGAVGQFAGGDPGGGHRVRGPTAALDHADVAAQDLDANVRIENFHSSTRRPGVRAA